MELRSLCPWCGKLRYRTKAAALSSALRTARRPRYRELRLRAYRCPAGWGWHLTSRRPPQRRPSARAQSRRTDR